MVNQGILQLERSCAIVCYYQSVATYHVFSLAIGSIASEHLKLTEFPTSIVVFTQN